MNSLFKVLTAGVTVVAACLLLASPANAGPPASRAYKLGGAWIASDVDSPLQWTYTVSPDPSGRRGAAYGSVTTELYIPGLSELTDKISPFVIDLVMTGKDTVRYNSVWYGVKNLPPGGQMESEVAFISMVWGELKFVAPGRAEGTHNFEFYLPYQDGDDDGLPDPGQLPVGALQIHTVDVRLGQH